MVSKTGRCNMGNKTGWRLLPLPLMSSTYFLVTLIFSSRADKINPGLPCHALVIILWVRFYFSSMAVRGGSCRHLSELAAIFLIYRVNFSKDFFSFGTGLKIGG
ncbi:hypothetical protein B0T13DRAFT_195059 [Neurospora crassa]|nr:hypothetical protein B0T13DRAFT_195059 [Neurospora crassa]